MGSVNTISFQFAHLLSERTPGFRGLLLTVHEIIPSSFWLLLCLESITYMLIFPARLQTGNESSISLPFHTAPSIEICPPKIYKTYLNKQMNSTQRNLIIPLPYRTQTHICYSISQNCCILGREHFFQTTEEASGSAKSRWLSQ